MLISHVSLIVISSVISSLLRLKRTGMPYGESGPKISMANKLGSSYSDSVTFGLGIVRIQYSVRSISNTAVLIVNTSQQ